MVYFGLPVFAKHQALGGQPCLSRGIGDVNYTGVVEADAASSDTLVKLRHGGAIGLEHEPICEPIDELLDLPHLRRRRDC